MEKELLGSQKLNVDRNSEQLEPLARRVLENTALMKRFSDANGSDNENLAREVIDEIRNYAQTLDPTITYVEGARLCLVLMKLTSR